ncbi:hypothetical protein O181_105086 [Austropuccinia psidii MF-1]|uniref:Uncharacterized protein n=1 Tax=Austropuccinia psidii MF-1 TaxID=1389203 RepID=A0A9Q3PLZ0_9BASI|nr:hypothetical protein [Austropuccinia psidii MF-1]
MEDARISTSSQSSASTFDTLIEGPEADISAITVVRPEPFPTGNNINIPVSEQKVVYCSKAKGVGTSAKSLSRNNDLLSSSEEVYGPRKGREHSEGVETHVLKSKGLKDKSFVEKPKHFFRGPEEKVGPRKGKQPSGSSSSLHKKECASTSAKRGQESPKEQSEGQEK